MERLTIIERTCGCPLYDQIWSWKADERSPSTPAQLVQFFYQFSKDISGGGVHRVCFEASSEEKLAPKRGAYPRYGAAAGHPRSNRHKSINVPPTRSLEMYVAHNEQIIGTIFVNRDYDKSCDKILSQILSEFTSHYSDVMIALMPQFIAASKHPDEALLNTNFISKFTTFGEIVAKYMWNQSSARPSHMLQPPKPSDRVGSLEGIGGDADGASIRIHQSQNTIDDDLDDLTTRHTHVDIMEEEHDTNDTLKTNITSSSQPSPQLQALNGETPIITTANPSNSSQAALLIRSPSGASILPESSSSSSSSTLLPAPRPTARSRASRQSKSRPTQQITSAAPTSSSSSSAAAVSASPSIPVHHEDISFSPFDPDDSKDAVHLTHTRYQISPSQSPPQLHTTLTSKSHPKEGRSSSVSLSLRHPINPQQTSFRTSHHDHDDDDDDEYG